MDTKNIAMALGNILALTALQGCTVLLALAFTPPDSLIRPALLPLLAALTFYTLPVIADSFSIPDVISFCAHNTIGCLFQYIDCALVSRWSFAARGLTSAAGGQRNARLSATARKELEPRTESLWNRLRWGFFATTALRAPNTPWEVKGTPTYYRSDPRQVPTRARFLFDNARSLASCMLLRYAAVSRGWPPTISEG